MAQMPATVMPATKASVSTTLKCWSVRSKAKTRRVLFIPASQYPPWLQIPLSRVAVRASCAAKLRHPWLRCPLQ
ncbi:hypothetical protein QWZ13_17525 [Reinekea marina]|uniref:hypothetical protein n=1 Tax=Reinekea marina TaxID=1310421 RepID=UPI0025B5BC82|nr:hypothetical protein [Reinekea marina]MDN3650710.1 hypothetical protein [Reinekea marina]